MTEEFVHEPVLAREVVELLRPSPGLVFLDGTLGGGGHASLFLEAGARVIGLDKDPRALAAASARLARYGEAFRAVRGDFRDARNVLAALGLDGVDGALVDLGVSSPQLDDPSRGFSFREGGPLDMRMGPEGQTLADLLARLDEHELTTILKSWGEEPFARPIARAIKRAVEAGEPLDTARLAELVGAAIPRKAWPKRIHPATRTFQAIRIAVNRELENLEKGLRGAIERLKPGGRGVVISFHSLEDRIVKHIFREYTTGCTCPRNLPVCVCNNRPRVQILTGRPVMASDTEISGNPRSRSAKLRAVEKL